MADTNATQLVKQILKGLIDSSNITVTTDKKGVKTIEIRIKQTHKDTLGGCKIKFK